MLLISLLMIVILACLLGMGIWQAANPAIDLLIAPGASHIQVLQKRPGQQVVVYQAPASNWRAVVDQRLREQHWRGTEDMANPYDSDNYYRFQRIWFITLTEMVAVRGTSIRAEITVRRRILVFGIGFP
jgi:Flp pilus assembly protein CpaB